MAAHHFIVLYFLKHLHLSLAMFKVGGLICRKRFVLSVLSTGFIQFSIYPHISFFWLLTFKVSVFILSLVSSAQFTYSKFILYKYFNLHYQSLSLNKRFQFIYISFISVTFKSISIISFCAFSSSFDSSPFLSFSCVI